MFGAALKSRHFFVCRHHVPVSLITIKFKAAEICSSVYRVSQKRCLNPLCDPAMSCSSSAAPVLSAKSSNSVSTYFFRDTLHVDNQDDNFVLTDSEVWRNGKLRDIRCNLISPEAKYFEKMMMLELCATMMKR